MFFGKDSGGKDTKSKTPYNRGKDTRSQTSYNDVRITAFAQQHPYNGSR